MPTWQIYLQSLEKFLQLKLFSTGKPVDPEDLRFVEMSNDTEGQKAIDELNGVEYDSKVISVSVARPREERPSNSRPHGGYNNSRRY